MTEKGRRPQRAIRWVVDRMATRPPFWAVALVAVNFALTVQIVLRVGSWDMGDWRLFTDAGQRIAAGENPYYLPADQVSFRWSPLLAWFFALIAPIGAWGWTALSLATLALLRDWRLIAAFLVAWPFWRDIETGASFMFVPLLAIVALRGSRPAALAYVALAVLVPRPLMLPVLAWLLWREPSLRVPSVVIALLLSVATVATGWADEWIAFLIDAAGESGALLTPLPTLGPFWLGVVAVGVWLTVKGRLGLASLAFAPYLTPSYPLMLLLEFPAVTRRVPGRRLPSQPRGNTPPAPRLQNSSEVPDSTANRPDSSGS